MTTAHRATFNPAKGGSSRGEGDLGKLSKQYSSRDLPGHTKLKYREVGQNAPEEISRRDLRKELEQREKSDRPSRSDKRSDVRAIREGSKKQRLDQVYLIRISFNIVSYRFLNDDIYSKSTIFRAIYVCS